VTIPREEPAPPNDPAARPRRPPAVELAAAILIISGIVGLLNSIDFAMRLGQRPDGAEALLAVSAAVNLLTIVVGLLVRSGRGWILAANVVAVAVFLEVTSGTGPGIVFGLLDLVVLVVLFLERRWFNRPKISP